jgi:hypothetical protein
MNYCSRLAALKTRSIRRGVWFRVLNMLERAQVDLTVRVVKNVQSPHLMKVLESIVNKLSEALQSKVARVMRSIGFPSALKLSRIAQSWGHKSAGTWAQDSRFARFLAVMHLNSGNSVSRRGR